MKDVVFITGNERKADYLAQYLGIPVEHVKMELDEIQSLDFTEVVRHKVRQAYIRVDRPVLVEDSGLEFASFGRLPGTFSKSFIHEIGLEAMCRLVDGRDRSATVRCVFGYFDGEHEAYFEGSMSGTIAEHPVGKSGFGFDTIFIPEGYKVTRAELSEDDDRKTYLRIKPFEQVKEFLLSR
ncbi:MAG: non-canonical purine NTP pyrophosphatase [Patescibacteria group bacterium]